MTFLSIFVPDFPVEAILRNEPELRSQSVVVLEGKPPLQKVFATNELARRAGLEPGMTRLQAETWPDLALRCRSNLQESAAHAALLDCAQSFSPRVEDTAPDTIILDITGTEALFGPPLKLARDLARRTSDLGLEANVAVASNPDAATLAARGFDGVIVLTPENQQARLGQLLPDVLFARHSRENEQEAQKFLNIFDRWGIRTLRALASLSELAISERLGQKGVHLHRLARGAVSRTLVPVEPPLIFQEAIELEHPIVLLEPLAFILNRLLEQICARLSTRSLATQELRLELQLDPAYNSNDSTSETTDSTHLRPSTRHFTRTLRLPVPMLDARIFLKLLQLDLRANPPGAPITKLWLSAEPARLRAGQAGLFIPPSPEPEKLELTMARISGIVGEGNVGSAELLDTHRPEGFRMRHFNPRDLATFRKNKRPTSRRNTDDLSAAKGCLPMTKHFSTWSSNKSHQVPHGQLASQASTLTALRLFRPPLLVTITVRNGVPSKIVCPTNQEVGGDVLWQAGPWRSSGDWWEHEPWSRDEWDIAVVSQAGMVLYRLVHDLLTSHWFLQGTYD